MVVIRRISGKAHSTGSTQPGAFGPLLLARLVGVGPVEICFLDELPRFAIALNGIPDEYKWKLLGGDG